MKRQVVRVLAVALLACAGGGASAPATASGLQASTRSSSTGDSVSVPAMLVATRGSHVVLRFDGSGRHTATFSDPGLLRPVGVSFGPDGDFYVAAGDTDRVMRFSSTGSTKGAFNQGGGLTSPRNVNFGPDGGLYVADGFQNRILRFDGATGAFDRVFVDDAALAGPTSFTFGPDGDLYAVSVLTHRVLRFDGASGALRGPFATTSLVQPHDLSFGPDGNLYVTNSGTGIVQRFRGDSGEWLGPFVNDGLLRQPLGMAWGPDGHLYVANQGGHEVRRYDGTTGASLGAFVAAGAGGLAQPSFFAFEPSPTLALALVPDASRPVHLVATGARPGARVVLVRGTAGRQGVFAECPSLAVALGEPEALMARIADESGNVVVATAGLHGSATLVAVDTGRCAASPPLDVNLP